MSSSRGGNGGDTVMMQSQGDERYSNGDVYSHYKELKILVPGPFVVLQGNDGDGLSNTMDGPLPVLAAPRASRRRRARQPASDTPSSNRNGGSQEEGEEDFQHVASTTGAHTAAGIVNGPRFTVTAGVVAAAAAADTRDQNERRNTDSSPFTSSMDEFVVVTEVDRVPEPQIDAQDITAIAQWDDRRRRTELQQRQDWEASLHQVPAEIVGCHTMMTRAPVTHANNDPQSRSWWQRNGEVAVLRELPTKLFDGSVTVHRIGTMPPGTTFHAMDYIELNSVTLLPIHTSRKRRRKQHRNGHGMILDTNGVEQSDQIQRVYPHGRPGIIQMVRFATKEGRTGYACLSLDGYPLLGPGLPNVYINPASAGQVGHAEGGWIWRVTCPMGAYVREGLDLDTRHTQTLPYGSLIRVTRRCINDQGLSRLRTSGYLTVGDDDNDGEPANSRIPVEGWCSELLNPLSGQRGIIAQPLPFPVPAVYRVTLPMGAVIRQDVELSSPQTGLAPFGSLVKVVGRAFSEHPVDQCIERLRLAGDRGWISVRLNCPPPEDDLVVELVDVDGEFDAEHPGLYHLNAQREVREERQRERELTNNNNSSDLSSVDENELSQDMQDDQSVETSPDSSSGNDNGEASRCVVCLTSNRNATIVHGETGHVVCCLVCARILKARGDKCPVCRLNIDLVIQHFYA